MENLKHLTSFSSENSSQSKFQNVNRYHTLNGLQQKISQNPTILKRFHDPIKKKNTHSFNHQKKLKQKSPSHLVPLPEKQTRNRLHAYSVFLQRKFSRKISPKIHGTQRIFCYGLGQRTRHNTEKKEKWNADMRNMWKG